MDTATGDNTSPAGFPEERLLKVFTGALRDAGTDQERAQIIEGALQVGYRRGLIEGAPPLQPEDLEGIADRFTTLASRMRWLQTSGHEVGALTLDDKEDPAGGQG